MKTFLEIWNNNWNGNDDEIVEEVVQEANHLKEEPVEIWKIRGLKQQAPAKQNNNNILLWTFLHLQDFLYLLYTTGIQGVHSPFSFYSNFNRLFCIH